MISLIMGYGLARNYIIRYRIIWIQWIKINLQNRKIAWITQKYKLFWRIEF